MLLNRASVVVGCCVFLSSVNVARAQDIRPHDISPQESGKIHPGVMILGLESMLLYRVQSGARSDAPTLEETNKNLFAMGGATLQYFIGTNFALGASASYFYANETLSVKDTSEENPKPTTESTHTDSGGLFFGTAHYFMPMLHGLYFKPGVGVGGFVGARKRPHPTEVDAEVRSSVSGLAGRLDLGFAFFPSDRVSIRAGIDGIYRKGSEKPDETSKYTVESSKAEPSFTNIDVGVSAGVGMVF